MFEDGGEESPLNRLITHIHDSLPTDKNGFQLLYLVTELVVNQFEVYGKGTGIKVSPPLFQYFLEPKDGVFAYNSYCKSIVEKCCKAESDEEFCLYMVSSKFNSRVYFIIVECNLNTVIFSFMYFRNG